MINKKYATSLTELLVAIALIGLLVLGISSLDTYSRFHLLDSDRRVQIQNDVSYVLEHMAKNITGTANRGGAIGDVNQQTINTAVPIQGDPTIRIWVDNNPNGIREGPPEDDEIAYRYTGYQIWYYAICRGPNCNWAGSATPEVIAYKITGFQRNWTDNYISANITVCWDPAETHHSCGTIDNPQVNMITRIKMPSVSVN